MICSGGVLFPGSICSIIGTYGTGKTHLFLLCLSGTDCRKERTSFISVSRKGKNGLIIYMKQKGWDIDQYLNKSLYVIKLDPTDFNLANNRIKNELPNLISEVHASRVVIDPISLFEELFETDAARRQEMYRFVEGLRDKQCTIMMTSETHMDNMFSSRHGLIEYLADTVDPAALCQAKRSHRCPPGAGSCKNADVGSFP